MPESFQEWFQKQLHPGPSTSFEADDSESRGRRSMRRAKAIFKNLGDPNYTEFLDEEIRNSALAFRGEGREQPSGRAGEILIRLCGLTGADFSDVIDPQKDPVKVIREAFAGLPPKNK